MPSLLDKIGGSKNENRQKDRQTNPKSESQTAVAGSDASSEISPAETRLAAIANCQHTHTRRRVIFNLVADRARIAVDLDAVAEAFDECLLCGWWEAVPVTAVESKSG